MIYIRRHLSTILIAFTTWTAGITIATYRERIATECAYHEGTNEGYRAGFAEGRRIQETDPEWDCATMGNRVCGPTATPPDTRHHTTQRVTKTARK